MYLCSSCAGSCPDMAMVVFVGRCSISIKQRGVFCIWYICSRKPFSLVLCSCMSLFVRVCVMMGGAIYILIFDTLTMGVIIGMNKNNDNHRQCIKYNYINIATHHSN